MSSTNRPTNLSNERERQPERWRNYARQRRQRQQNDFRNERLERYHDNSSWQRHEIAQGANTLEGNQIISDEATMHSNATTEYPLLIPPNGDVRRRSRLTNIRSLHEIYQLIRILYNTLMVSIHFFFFFQMLLLLLKKKKKILM